MNYSAVGGNRLHSMMGESFWSKDPNSQETWFVPSLTNVVLELGPQKNWKARAWQLAEVEVYNECRWNAGMLSIRSGISIFECTYVAFHRPCLGEVREGQGVQSLYVYWGICNRDGNGIKLSTSFLRSGQGIKAASKLQKSTDEY